MQFQTPRMQKRKQEEFETEKEEWTEENLHKPSIPWWQRVDPCAWSSDETEAYIISVDSETTGLHPATDRMVEWAATVWTWGKSELGWKRRGRFRHYCQSDGVPMCAESIKITGLSQAFVDKQPRISLLLTRFHGFLEACCVHKRPRIIIGWNVPFDTLFLSHSACRQSPKEEDGVLYLRSLKITSGIDLLATTKVVLADAAEYRSKVKRTPTGEVSFNLGDIYSSIVGNTMAKALAGAHGASVDCQAVLEILEKLRALYLPTLQQALVSTQNEKGAHGLFNLMDHAETARLYQKQQRRSQHQKNAVDVLQKFHLASKKRSAAASSSSLPGSPTAPANNKIQKAASVQNVVSA